MIEEFILNHHTKLDPDSFTLHGRRSFLKQEPMINFTNALDKHSTPNAYPTTTETTPKPPASEQPSKKTQKN